MLKVIVRYHFYLVVDRSKQRSIENKLIYFAHFLTSARSARFITLVLQRGMASLGSILLRGSESLLSPKKNCISIFDLVIFISAWRGIPLTVESMMDFI